MLGAGPAEEMSASDWTASREFRTLREISVRHGGRSDARTGNTPEQALLACVPSNMGRTMIDGKAARQSGKSYGNAQTHAEYDPAAEVRVHARSVASTRLGTPPECGSWTPECGSGPTAVNSGRGRAWVLFGPGASSGRTRSIGMRKCIAVRNGCRSAHRWAKRSRR